MNKKQLKEIFQKDYDRERFIYEFLFDFLPEDFEPVEKDIKIDDFKPRKINEDVYFIGKSENLGIDVYELTHESEHDPRVTVSKDAFQFMRNRDINKALMIFKSKNDKNYRFSLLTIKFKYEKGKAELKYSNPKRYSYYLGPDAKVNTPSQMLSKSVDIFEDLKERFSIEVVNKEFYKKIALKFTKLVGGERKINSKKYKYNGDLTYPIENFEQKQRFAVRLIGRLLFVWFLKQKGYIKSKKKNLIISDQILSFKAVTSYKNSFKKNYTYYHTILEPLFFEILRKKKERRYDKFKKIDVFNNVPFLNGGLFEPHEEDYYEYDEYLGSKYAKILKIPDSWFKEFFEILEEYHFTIDENTDVDIELSIDPEMLGRIFENLLAEINPETKESAKESTGSYYTPRSIVTFMVEESLKEYLKNKTEVDPDLIDFLFYFSLKEEDVEELYTNQIRKKIIKALDEVKILDPAVGSGAFPMGLLQKIIYIIHILDPENEIWKKIKFKDSLHRQAIGKNLDYIRKLGLIRDNIYGVDVQTIATEISKLRFFLSLIVDENINNEEDNLGLQPLPNLDFKFVSADFLIDTIEEKRMKIKYEDFFDKFERKIEKYFNTYYYKRKKELKKEIIKLIKNMVAEKERQLNEFLKGINFKKFKKIKISKKDKKNLKKINYEKNLWKSYKNIFQDRSVDFFNLKYFFPEVINGFDIIIANPPYIESRNNLLSKEYKDHLQENVQFRWGKHKQKFISRGSDLCIYFFERSLKLLKDSGIIVFITQNAWLDTKYGISFQKFLLKNSKVKKIIDSYKKRFDKKDSPKINTIIVELYKNNYDECNKLSFLRQNDNKTEELKKINYNSEKLRKYKWGTFLYKSEIITYLLNKIFERGDFIKDLSNIQSGQGLNITKKYEIPIDFIKKNKIPKEICYPYFTKDEPSFKLNYTSKYLIPLSDIDKEIKIKLENNHYKTFDFSSTTKTPPKLILARGIGKHFCSYNQISAFSSSYVEIYGNDEIKLQKIWLFLNSTIAWILREITGRKNLGGGMLKAEAYDLNFFPIFFNFKCENKILNLFNSLDDVKIKRPLIEINEEHHKKIDDIVFDFLRIDNEKRIKIKNEFVKIYKYRISKNK